MELLKTHLWMVDLIYQAGEKIKQEMQQVMKVEEKSSFRDLVTNVDKGIEDFFIENIKKEFPTHRIMGEESKNNRFQDVDGYVWIIDPIDGTMNFIKQQDNFGILIALFLDGQGLLGYIYDVMQNKLAFAIKGNGAYLNGKRLPKAKDIGIKDALMNIGDCVMRSDIPESRKLLTEALAFRSVGSAALAELAVFEGKICAYLNYRLNPWDYAPAFIFAEELGYHCQTVAGQKLGLMGQTDSIIGTEKALKEIQAILNGAVLEKLI